MNSTELIADVKRKAQIDAGQSTLSDSDILDLATKELQTVIVPKILSVRENFFATYKDFTLSSARSYRIPPQATGSKILGLEIINGTDRRQMIQIGMMEVSSREGFYIRSGSVVLSTYAPQTGTLRMHFSARPGVLSETAFSIYAVTGPSLFTDVATGWAVNASICVQKSSSPFEWVLQDELIINSVVTDQIVVNTTTLPDLAVVGVAIGDSVTRTAVNGLASPIGAAQSQCFYPQIPIEMHDWLSYRTACRILEHLGHEDLLALKIAKLGDLEKDMLALISPRVDNAGKIIVGGELCGYIGI